MAFLAAQQAATQRPGNFKLLGLDWIVLPGVYSPTLGAATEFFSANLPYPQDGHFLEIGSGTGVTAIYAALRGCRRVTATDISECAVRNAGMNIERHGVTETVKALQSDLFDSLPVAERYDVIYWNSNYIHAPTADAYESDMQRALFDPGYTAHRRYIREGYGKLNPKGRLLLGFSNLGDHEALHLLAQEAGLKVSTLCAAKKIIGAELAFPVTLQLLELTHR